MRIKLKTIAEVFHFWANQVQERGESGSVSFRDGRLYSYSACIARHLPNGMVAFCEAQYSMTTAGHKSAAMGAVNHKKRITVADPGGTVAHNLRVARAAIYDLLKEAQERPRIRQTTRDALRAKALRIADDANAFFDAFPEDERGCAVRIDTSNLESIRAEIEAYNAAQIQLRTEQALQRSLDLADSLEKWRVHDILVRTGLYGIPPALRLSQDRKIVETSHGATIPVEDAIRLWPLVLRAKSGGKAYCPKHRRLGNYHLTEIKTDGGIVVGCHTIAFSELERIAKQLELI